MRTLLILIFLTTFSFGSAAQPSLWDGGRYRSLSGREIVLRSRQHYAHRKPVISRDSLADGKGSLPVWAGVERGKLYFHIPEDSLSAGGWRDSSRMVFDHWFSDVETLHVRAENSAASLFIGSKGKETFYRTDLVNYDDFRFESWRQSRYSSTRFVYFQADGPVYVARYNPHTDSWRLLTGQVAPELLASIVEKIRASAIYRLPESELFDHVSDTYRLSVRLNYNGQSMLIGRGVPPPELRSVYVFIHEAVEEMELKKMKVRSKDVYERWVELAGD